MLWFRIGQWFLWIVGALLISLIVFASAYGGGWLLGCADRRQLALSSHADWAQAIGAVFAIVIGFTGVLYQVHRQKAQALEQEAAAGRAAHLLAFDALETVTERLDAALQPSKDIAQHRLRGLRTTEMVSAMREFEISRIPATMLADFIRLRSRVYAINGRITELYEAEAEKSDGPQRAHLVDQRYNWLTSAVSVWNEAIGQFEDLEKTASKLGAKAQTLTRPASITGYVRRSP